MVVPFASLNDVRTATKTAHRSKSYVRYDSIVCVHRATSANLNWKSEFFFFFFLFCLIGYIIMWSDVKWLPRFLINLNYTYTHYTYIKIHTRSWCAGLLLLLSARKDINLSGAAIINSVDETEYSLLLGYCY